MAVKMEKIKNQMGLLDLHIVSGNLDVHLCYSLAHAHTHPRTSEHTHTRAFNVERAPTSDVVLFLAGPPFLSEPPWSLLHLQLSSSAKYWLWDLIIKQFPQNFKLLSEQIILKMLQDPVDPQGLENWLCKKIIAMKI